MFHLKRFGQYEIVRKLGRSMTDVYLAVDTQNGRNVALKIIEELRDASTQNAIEAERRGVAIQKQLRDLDPRIIEVYGYGMLNGCFYVAMEYVEGKSIAEILQAEKRLDPQRAARYAKEICSQIGKLHSFQAEIDGRRRAVVHGDIKPSNIQIGPNDEVRLIDFGIAKSITFTHNLTNHNLGSPSYCSPERLLRGQVDPHADLWALGVTLYEMVAGTPPYQAQTTRKLENLIQSRRPPRALPDDCPPALKSIIFRALAANMERRYATAAEFEHDLETFLKGGPPLAGFDRSPTWDSKDTIERTMPMNRATARLEDLVAAPKAVRRPWNWKRFILDAAVLQALAAGLVTGVFLFGGIPALYYWTETAPIRNPRSYVHRGVNDVEADWKLYQELSKKKAFFGSVADYNSNFRANLIAAADDVVERYAGSADPSLASYDWHKAQVCLRHAQELDRTDRTIRGKLELCSAFANLAAGDSTSARPAFEKAAADLPKSPEPHLGLGRIFIYSQRNLGRAIAEFHQAERLGYKLGPREYEEQADGYKARAEFNLRQAENSRTGSAEQRRFLQQAKTDFDRARQIYEPIEGYSKVSENLEELYRAQERDQEMLAVAMKPPAPVKRRVKYGKVHR